ncbi:hypothetical protein [Methanolacinia paynteri]|uniref:hypothetical protein n=1 Tax=Methanolacinia paynteri TaxID=230356 RepID=UPI000694E00F|nr:hypothetical protein [Methanolacinia paynteri]
MSTETDYLKLIQHSAGDEGWADDMNNNFVKVDSAFRMAINSDPIINGDFRIWQRGDSLVNPMNSFIYLCDRWCAYGSGNSIQQSKQSFEVGQTDIPGNPENYHRMIVPAETTCELGQYIEGVRTYAGEDVTLSFWARSDRPLFPTLNLWQLFGSGGSSSVNFAMPQYALSTEWEFFEFNLSVPDIAGKTIGLNDSLFIGLHWGGVSGSSATIDTTLVTTNQGSTANSFRPRPLGLEEMLCQRYCWVPDFGLSNTLFGSGKCISDTSGIITMKPPVPMRSVPTMKYSGDFGLQNASIALNAVTAMWLDGTTTTRSHFYLGCQAAGGLVAGDGTVLAANGDPTAKMVFDSELHP